MCRMSVVSKALGSFMRWAAGQFNEISNLPGICVGFKQPLDGRVDACVVKFALHLRNETIIRLS
jgi:hypothetical protein